MSVWELHEHERQRLREGAQFGGAVAAGGAGFVAVTAAANLLQGALRIPAHAAVLPRLAGLAAVCLGSVAAAESAALAEAGAPWAPRRRVDDDERVRYAAAGSLLFLVLGGRYRSLAPSDVRHVGAFARPNGSLPAGIDYASGSERHSVATLGRLLGCHSCGRQRGRPFIADHMPPVAVVKRSNARWYRRLLGLTPLEQRFFPQCRPCSQRQAVAVKVDKPDLVFHAHRLRPHHLTGALAVLFLGVSSSSSPSAPPQPSAPARGVVGVPDLVRHVGADLPSLRAAEKRARGRLRRLRDGETCDCERRLRLELRQIEAQKKSYKRRALRAAELRRRAAAVRAKSG